ncbi:hypothetical protein THAOC_34451 [Thalassiosira oceanica]|uniref:ADP-ribosylation factor-like protein 3 n=1 Tax=Thalassiosira oceanica TaxID=159749 RepID=K0R4W7_THAOC|nr:hypothetical protein THAOC_34451 [Thalassiosira oceanica]|eukprot:EJK46864.1 hypothetical protein THAOC_34451 [Thalassiosira oceanica]
MGLLSLLQRLRGSGRELKLLVLGLDNAGKTSVLTYLCKESLDEVMPTQGFNVKQVSSGSGITLNAWDIGGQRAIRPYWRNYFDKSDALCYVVDSSDEVRLKESAEELEGLLEEEKLRGVPLLVLANKQDLLSALTSEEIEESLNLKKASKHSRKMKVQGCSTKTGEGIEDGLRWLVKAADKASKK